MNENKTNINYLPCIYTVHCLNAYKMGLFSKLDLSSFIKIERKIINNRLKYSHFCEELEY